jgi:hypothetical protein
MARSAALCFGVVMRNIIQELRKNAPPIWLGTRTAEFTGGLYEWETLKNKFYKRELPDNCFVRVGQRLAVQRDPFLGWLALQFSDARDPCVRPPLTRKADTPKAAVRLRRRADSDGAAA